MKKYSAIAWASALALVLTACGGGEEPTDGTTGSVVDPNAPGSTTGGTTGTDAAAGDPAATTESAAAPTSAVPFGSVPEGSITSDVKIRSLAALIPSTPADARLNGAASGRPDPFAGQVIRVTPVFPDSEGTGATPFGGGPSAANFSVTPGAFSPGSSPAGGSAPARATRPATPARGSNVGGSTGGSGGGSTVSGKAQGSSSGTAPTRAAGPSAGSTAGSAASSPRPLALPDLAARPPIPEPTLARGVEVTGIILVGSNYQAIVKAPNEPNSRYVSVGQRLSNGRVLVKRIESQGSEPVVILEEDGVEVVRSIGAPTEGPGGAGTAAVLPLPPFS